MARTVFCEYLKQDAEGLDLVNVFLIQLVNKHGANGSKNKPC